MLSLLLLLLVPFVQQELKEIPPAEASRYQEKSIAVVMEVASSSFLRDRDLCFLNSMKNHRDDKNFTVVLRKEGIKAFAEKDIKDVAKHFRNKKIRVTGKVEMYKGKPQIIVTKFQQIRTLAVVVQKDTPPSKDENRNIRKFQ